jgi:hypothetical protein
LSKLLIRLSRSLSLKLEETSTVQAKIESAFR